MAARRLHHHTRSSEPVGELGLLTAIARLASQSACSTSASWVNSFTRELCGGDACACDVAARQLNDIRRLRVDAVAPAAAAAGRACCPGAGYSSGPVVDWPLVASWTYDATVAHVAKA